MKERIKIGIVGYGNLGRGVEIAINENPDMQLVCIITKRNPKEINAITPNIEILNVKDVEKMIGKVDVMILCSGSAFDLPVQGPQFAKMFNVIDSFDTHANIPQYFNEVNSAALEGNKVAIISVGWDPGLFSLNRLYASAVLPSSKTYTFWGKGFSQGHSNAIKNIKGVIDAVQYTIPIEEAIEKVRKGLNPNLTTREKHTRECFVVVEEGADKNLIEKQIKEMKNYYDEYDTTVHFVTQEELNQNHKKMLHGGFVITTANTGLEKENKEMIEYSVKLDSNPEFTSSVLVAYARAAARLAEKKDFGGKTVFDIPPVLLSMKTPEELRKEML